MKHSIVRMAVVAAILLFAFATCGLAQELAPGSGGGVSQLFQATPPHVPSTPGTLFTPKSSMAQTVPPGHKFAAHTNVQIFYPAGVRPDEAPPYPGYGYETPASIDCVYGFASTLLAGCNPNSTTSTYSGGANTIAIVDAYDDPSAEGDLAWFSLQFGVPLTASQFKVVWANTGFSSCPVNGGYGVPTDDSGGWEAEESLDIEWAHAMAPKAKIYLVEACSNYDIDLSQAVLVANNLVACGASKLNTTTGVLGACTGTGKGEVSMSWGGDEYADQTGTGCTVTADPAPLNDSCFTQPGVVYFASTGDGPGVNYPSTSPNVVAAGGTTIRRNPSTFAFEQQTAWVFTGGGESAIETRPTYQPSAVGSWRAVPDLAFDSDPYTGVYVYDTFPLYGYDYYEWAIFGGTSVSAQALAGIVNASGHWAASSTAELTTIYTTAAGGSYATDFTDISAGFCGPYMGFTAGTGWDFCTGVGVPKGHTTGE